MLAGSPHLIGAIVIYAQAIVAIADVSDWRAGTSGIALSGEDIAPREVAHEDGPGIRLALVVARAAFFLRSGMPKYSGKA